MRWLLIVISIVLVNAVPLAAEAASVNARFDVNDRRATPFPSDRFTVPDGRQNTGLRVNVPKPDCAVRPTDCINIDVINTLDGFNVQPRISIPFDGAIEVRTVTSGSVFLVRLQNSLPDGQPSGRVIGINQIVWDVATTTLHVESDEMLEQHTRYALVVTKRVLDQQGKSVKADPAFLAFIDDANTDPTGDAALDAYRTVLRDSLARLDGAGIVPRGQVVTASVFTTQSVTAILEKIRDQIVRGSPAAADFALGPAGTPAVYRLAELRDIVFVQQFSVDPRFRPTPTPFPDLSNLAPGAVGTIAFGKYVSPDYLTSGRFIPPYGTRLESPQVQALNDIFFNLVLPAGSPPPYGWPVAIYGHGGMDSKQGGPLGSRPPWRLMASPRSGSTQSGTGSDR